MNTTLDNHHLAHLNERISGPVLTPQDAGYDQARASTTASSTAGRR